MKYVLFLMMVLFSSQAVAIDCSKQPTCEELNYSKEDNPKCDKNGYILCPYDQSYKKCIRYNCETLGFTQSDKSGWCGKISKCPTDNTYTLCKALCEIGDVYYADGTCGYADDYDGSKIPVGVVYYVSDGGRHGKVINLKDLGKSSSSADFNPAEPYENYKNFEWNSYGEDIPGVENWNCDYLTIAQTGDHSQAFWSKGKEYTEIIADYQNNNLKYAAPATLAFYPPNVDHHDSKVGQGHWYLPILGELMDLYGYNYSQVSVCTGNTGANGNTKSMVNATLTALKNKGVMAEMLTDYYYWSSSEHPHSIAWDLYIFNGARYFDIRKENKFYVRASLQF